MMYLIIILFVGLFIIQFYFRIRVVKVYQRLSRNKVEFDASHIFNNKKMENEVFPRYPQHVDDIKKFVREMKVSLQIATIFILLIFVAAYIIKTY